LTDPVVDGSSHPTVFIDFSAVQYIFFAEQQQLAEAGSSKICVLQK